MAVKGAQAGSFLGTASAVPSLVYTAYANGPSAVTAESALQMATTRAGTGFTYGLAAISALGAYKVLSLDKDGVQDRAYRLHYNSETPPFHPVNLLSALYL